MKRLETDLTALEPAQWVNSLASPLPRRCLNMPTIIVLWRLRAYIVIALPLVVYAFLHATR
ncbi:MAG: hypothetical protein ABI182_05940 [Candidatus Baltobacteraceae bacterium]